MEPREVPSQVNDAWWGVLLRNVKRRRIWRGLVWGDRGEEGGECAIQLEACFHEVLAVCLVVHQDR